MLKSLSLVIRRIDAELSPANIGHIRGYSPNAVIHLTGCEKEEKHENCRWPGDSIGVVPEPVTFIPLALLMTVFAFRRRHSGRAGTARILGEEGE